MDAPAAPPLDADAIPLAWTEITPAWMTAALASRCPDAEVAAVELLMADDGTNRRARIGVTYAEGAGPATLFLKAHAADHRLTHLRNGNLWNEARLFASGIELPVDHPLVYKAVVDLLGLDFLLVMEDIRRRGADPRDSRRPLTPAQAANGLKALARLHSRYWGLSPADHPELDWLQTWAPTEGWRSGLRRFVPLGLERGRAALPAPVAQMGCEHIVDLWARYVGVLATAPVTLTHGDAHIGNIYVLPGDEVGFLDWQVVRRGRWSQDVGHFLTGALSIDDCRRHERELVELYRTSLTAPDDQRPSAEAAWLEYRATPIYGLTIWLSTLGAGAGWQPHEVSQRLAERFAEAFVRLDTLQALDAIGA